MDKQPTERQLDFLEALNDLMNVQQIQPTLKNLADEMGVKGSSGIVKHVRALKKMKYITYVSKSNPMEINFTKKGYDYIN